MRTKQPRNFRTDLVVFTAREKLDGLLEMGCSAEGRGQDKEEDRCVAIPHIPLKVSPNDLEIFSGKVQ